MTDIQQRPASPREAGAATSALRVVAIGGGTGLSTLLKGLKQYVAPPAASLAGPKPHSSFRSQIGELCAVVTVSDDGGSSGRLRKELNMPAPGDVRNCIVALAEEEALLSKLFKYLFLSALAEITGDFSKAVELSAAILATRGNIFPATTSNAQLYAVMDDGSF